VVVIGQGAVGEWYWHGTPERSANAAVVILRRALVRRAGAGDEVIADPDSVELSAVQGDVEAAGCDGAGAGV
jgi:hypothetical protein